MKGTILRQGYLKSGSWFRSRGIIINKEIEQASKFKKILFKTAITIICLSFFLQGTKLFPILIFAMFLLLCLIIWFSKKGYKNELSFKIMVIINNGIIILSLIIIIYAIIDNMYSLLTI